jgi:uncharacterized protein YybS (DUF2232 family)
MPYRAVIIAGLQAGGLFIAGLLNVPFLSQIIILFVPVPLVAASLLHGRKAAAAAACIAAALIAVLGGSQVAALLLFLSLVLMALGLAEGMARRLRPEYAILLGGLLPLIPLALFLSPLLVKTGKNPFLLAEEYLRQNLAEVQQLYDRMGLAEVSQSVAAVSDTVVFYLVRLMPGLLLATSLLQAATCYGMSRVLVLRRSPASPLAAGPSLAAWHAPDTWVWGLIAALGLVAALPRDSVAWFAGLNLGILYLLVYIAQGVAIVEFYQRKAKVPALWRSFLHAFLLALPTVVLIIAFGIVDIWGDFRKVRTPAPGSSSSG